MRQDRKNTKPSGASITTHSSGLAKSAWPNGGEIHAPMQRQRPAAALSSKRRISRHGIGEDDVGNESRQGDAGRHVVVDAQHVGAQTLVHRDAGPRPHAGCAYLLSI